MDNKAHIKKNIFDLDSWAKSVGARLVVGEPWDEEDIALFPELVEPFWGEFSLTLPQSYRDFLGVCSSLKLEVNWGDEDDQDWSQIETMCWIYNPNETINRRGWVLIPEGVSIGDRAVTTHHLLGIAAANDISDTYWCLVTDEGEGEGEGDELPIVLHNTNSLQAARYIDDGSYVKSELKRHQSFLSWFNAYVNELINIDKHQFESIY